MMYNKNGEIKMKEKCCHYRKMPRGEKDIELINNRLNRISGQINGIKRMVNSDVYCNDILVQLAAVEKAIKNLSNMILEDHIYSCISSDLEDGKLDSIDEIVNLFKRFNK